MKILSWNVNGLRSVYKKGFLDWLEKSGADIVCLQETKAQKEQLPTPLLKTKNYHAFFNSATKKGYSGVAVYSRVKPLGVKRRLGFKQFDNEGRLLELKYPGFTLINLYLPHGSRDKSKLPYKLKSYQFLLKKLAKIKNRKVILIGDFNIAHTELDLARPQQNKNNVMFTPEERDRLTQLVNLGFIDTFRKFNKEGGHYTWWPYYANARQRNLGWRLDCAFVSKKLAPNLKKAFILPKVVGSDHCPIGIQIVG